MSKTIYEVPYFQTPNDIFEMDLSNNEKLVYMYLCRCGNDGKDAFPSYKTIADKCSISKSSAIRCMNKLVEIGLVIKTHRRIDERMNKSNIYKVNYNLEGSVTDTPPSVMNTPCSVTDAPIKRTIDKELEIKNKNYTSFATLKDGSVFLDLYGRFFKAYMEKDHMKIANENISDLDGMLEEVEYWDEDMMRENLHDYFTSLPNGNNGNVLSFAKAYHRYR